MKKTLYAVMNVLVFFLAVQPVRAEYRIAELADLGWGGDALAINSLGQVVGASSLVNIPCSHSVLWGVDGRVQDLGTLTGEDYAQGAATGINDQGVIVGASNVVRGRCDEGTFHAYVIAPEDNVGKDGIPDTWYRDKDGNGVNDLMIDLFFKDPQGSIATGINHAGQIIGYVVKWDKEVYKGFFGFVINPLDRDGDGKADTWYLPDADGVNKLMIMLEGSDFSSPNGINNKGEVVGVMYDYKTMLPAYSVVWSALTGKMVRKISLFGSAINDYGVVAGSSGDIATFEENKVVYQIGTLGGKRSSANAINNSLQIVGKSLDASGNSWAWRAFLWQKDKGILDLGALAGGTSEAKAINQKGHVVGRSSGGDNVLRAVMWSDILTPVEEVQTIAADLTALVQDGSISSGDASALTATLDTAIQKLDGGNTTAACNILQAFVNQTNAKVKSGKLSAEQGRALIDAAGSVSACK